MKTRYTTVYKTAIPFTKAHQLDPGWILHQISICVNVFMQLFISSWNHMEFEMSCRSMSWSTETSRVTGLLKDHMQPLMHQLLYLSVSPVYDNLYQWPYPHTIICSFRCVPLLRHVMQTSVRRPTCDSISYSDKAHRHPQNISFETGAVGRGVRPYDITFHTFWCVTT